jgi:hypothetical protein
MKPCHQDLGCLGQLARQARSALCLFGLAFGLHGAEKDGKIIVELDPSN